MMFVLPGVVLSSAASVALLRAAWSGRAGSSLLPTLAGVVLLVVSLVLAGLALGPVRGPVIAIALTSVLGMTAVAAGRLVRTSIKADRAALRLTPAGAGWTLGARIFIALPFASVGALGLTLTYVAFGPGDIHTRMVIGVLASPLICAAGAVWVLTDRLMVRSVGALSAFAALGWAAALLRGAL